MSVLQLASRSTRTPLDASHQSMAMRPSRHPSTRSRSSQRDGRVNRTRMGMRPEPPLRWAPPPRRLLCHFRRRRRRRRRRRCPPPSHRPHRAQSRRAGNKRRRQLELHRGGVGLPCAHELAVQQPGRRLHLPRGLRADGGAPRAQEAAPARGWLVSDRYISYACAGWGGK